MRKITTIMTMLLAAAALSSLGAASASANWFVNGTELKSSAPGSTTAKVDESMILLVQSLGDLTIECDGGTIDFTVLQLVGPGSTLTFVSITLLNCNTTKPTLGCALEEPNESITTNKLNGRAFLKTGTEDGVLFSPQTKKTLAEISFSASNTCALAGIQPLKGAVTVGAPTGQTEEVAQALVGLGSVENNSLEIGNGNKAILVGGKALVTLAGGSKWSFK
jgi:hypothetical protein